MRPTSPRPAFTRWKGHDVCGMSPALMRGWCAPWLTTPARGWRRKPEGWGTDDLNDDVIEGYLLAQAVLQHADTMNPGTEQRMTSTEWLHCLSRLYSGDELRLVPKGVADGRQGALRASQAPPAHPRVSGRAHRQRPYPGGSLPRNDPPGRTSAARAVNSILTRAARSPRTARGARSAGCSSCCSAAAPP